MADNLLDLYLGNNTVSPAAKEAPTASLIDSYLGPAQASVPETLVASNVPTPEKFEEGWKAQGSKNYTKEPSDIVKNLQANPLHLPLPTSLGENIAKHFNNNISYTMEGMNESSTNRPLGVGKTILGGLGVALSPISGAIDSFVSEPVAQLTGSKEAGERAGFIAGSGFPVAKAGQMAVKALPTNKAITAIVDTIGKDNIAGVIQELKSNDRLSLMDVVPATRQMSQKLITTEGQHQNKFEKFVTDRIGSAKDVVTDIHSSAMGTPVNIVDKVNSLKQAAKDVGNKEINPAVAGSKPVDITGVISNIDAKLKPGVNSVITAGEPLALGDIEKPLAEVRKFLTDDKSFRTNPDSLHKFQSALRAKAEDLLNSTDGTTRQKGQALMSVRNDIVNAIDNASPRIKLADGTETGSYKQALSNFRDEKQVENAFNMGMLVTKNRLGRLEDDPKFWDNWVKDASPQELEAAREGAKLALQHNIKAFKAGARKAEDVVESQFNTEKLSSLFGKDEINQMAKHLKDERNIAITNQKLIHGSDTAMRQKADSRVDLPQEKPLGLGAFVAPIAELAGNYATGYPAVGTSVALAALGAKKGLYKFSTLPLAKTRNEKITDLLTATGSDRDELIKILESQIPQAKQSLLSRTRNLALPVLPP